MKTVKDQLVKTTCSIVMMLLVLSAHASGQQAERSGEDVALDRQLEGAYAAFERGHYGEAQEAFQSVRTKLEGRRPLDLRLAVVLNMLTAMDAAEHFGSLEWSKRRDEQIGRVLQVAETVLGPTHEDFLLTLEVGAAAYGGPNEPLTRATYERWMNLLAQTLGPNHPKVRASRLLWQSQILVGRSNLLEQSDQTREAESRVREALKVQEDEIGDQHPDVAKTLVYLSAFPAIAHNERISLLRRAVAIRRAAPGKQYLDDITALGALILQEDDPLAPALLAETEGHRDRALEGRAVRSGSLHRRSVEALRDVLQVLSLKGMVFQGIILVDEARTIARGVALQNLTIAAYASGLGREHPGLGDMMRELASVYRPLGRSDEAEHLEARAKAIQISGKK
jgi:hypothetical protein